MRNPKNNLEVYILDEDRKSHLPRVINKISSSIRNCKDLDKFLILKEEIFSNEKILYKKTDNSFFTNINNREGDCLDLSLLYHFILNRIEVPNNLVSAKGHTMLKIPFFQKLLESTNGSFQNQEDYRIKRGIPLCSINKEVYFSELSDEEVFALYLNKKSRLPLKRNQIIKAMQYINEAISLSKRIPEIFYNKGCLLNKEREFKAAIRYFDKTLVLDPLFYEAIQNKGISYAQIGKKDLAEKCFKKVVSEARKPEKEKAEMNLKILKS